MDVPGNPVLEAIRARRTVRAFRPDPIASDVLQAVLEAGRWAPSGKNTQPWRFVVVESPGAREELGKHVTQGDMIRTAPVTIAVLLDTDAGYDPTKDAQGIGACVQNMMLAVHTLGLGACWIGRTHDPVVERLIGAAEHEALMLLLPVGYPGEAPKAGQRRPLEDLLRKV